MRRSTATRYTPDTKVAQICDRLRELARQCGPGGRLPTARELCVLFDANKVTLNNALDRLEAERVLYRKARSGIFVSPKLNHLHILVLLDAAFFTQADLSPFWGLLWGKLAQEAQRRTLHGDVDFSFTLVSSLPDALLPEIVTREVVEGHADAVLAVGLEPDAAHWLMARIPCVSYACPGSCLVGADLVSMIEEGVRLLVARGCRRPVLLYPWTVERGSGVQRIPEWERVLARFDGLAEQQGWRAEVMGAQAVAVAGGTRQEQGRALAQALFSRPREGSPDGLLVMDDMMTIGVLAEMRERNIHPGKDVPIVTHANTGSPILYGYDRELDRVLVDPQEIADTMFRLLDDLLAGKTPEMMTRVPLHTKSAPR